MIDRSWRLTSFVFFFHSFSVRQPYLCTISHDRSYIHIENFVFFFLFLYRLSKTRFNDQYFFRVNSTEPDCLFDSLNLIVSSIFSISFGSISQFIFFLYCMEINMSIPLLFLPGLSHLLRFSVLRGFRIWILCRLQIVCYLEFYC